MLLPHQNLGHNTALSGSKECDRLGELWCGLPVARLTSGTYRPELEEVLQVFLFVRLESVERDFGGQLAGCNTNTTTRVKHLTLSFPFTMIRAEFHRLEHTGSCLPLPRGSGGNPRVPARSSGPLNENVSYWTGSSPAWTGLACPFPSTLRDKTCCWADGIKVCWLLTGNTFQPNELLTKNNKRVAECDPGWRVITVRPTLAHVCCFRPWIKILY